MNWRKAIKLAAVLLMLVFLWQQAVLAGGNVTITRVFQPSSADTYVDENNATTNYGTLTTMIVTSRINKNARSLVIFDISSLPSGSTVSSATLSLYMSAAPSSSRTYGVHSITASWTETGATWTIQPTHNAVATSTTTTGTTSGVWLNWTVTSDVSAFLSSPPTATNYGWKIIDATEGAAGQGFSATFLTRENTAAEKPKLTITFTAPWDSYEDLAHTIVRDLFNNTYTTVYMKGTGFATSTYDVGYYDGDTLGGGQWTATDQNVSVAGDGILNSQYLLTTDPTAAAGTWHVLVQPAAEPDTFPSDYNTAVGAPDTYGILANDSFTAEASAIPEIPTVLAGIAVAGACFALYYWMRKRRLKYAQA